MPKPVHAVLLVAVSTMLVACAVTDERGWEGQNATPFGSADAVCRAEADEQPGASSTAYDACMVRNGWSRDRGD